MRGYEPRSVTWLHIGENAAGCQEQVEVTVDIVSAIDQAVGCHTCGGSLEKSVSDLFCSEHCQQAWHAKRVTSPPLSDLYEIPLRSAPSHTVVTVTSPASAYGHGGLRWLAMRRDAENYPLAHFEWSPDGGLVDNTAAIRHQNERCNTDIRAWVGDAAWDYLQEGEGS